MRLTVPRLIACLCTALLLSLPQAADAYQRPGRTERVSLGTDASEGDRGSGADEWWGPSLSSDARYVAFDSDATNLVPQDTNEATDVLVRDRTSLTTELVSVTGDGVRGNAASRHPAISGDGRYVAFESVATNLFPGDTNGEPDIFIRDRVAGTTARLAAGISPAISADGRFVAYESGFQVWVRDRVTGDTTMASVASDGSPAQGASGEPALNVDGSVVAFRSSAPNLRREDSDTEFDVFVHDMVTGRTELASISTEGVSGNGSSSLPAISGDGRTVAFWSYATNFVPNQSEILQMFVRDRYTETTEQVSIAGDGRRGDWWTWGRPAISHDGRFVAFRGGAMNLVPNDGNGEWDVFVHDRLTGATDRVSVASGGTEGDGVSAAPSMSADGRYVAFASYSTNLVDEADSDLNWDWDVFVRDRGPSIGPGSLVAAAEGDRLVIRGWASFSGIVLSSALDPTDTGVQRFAGAEIIRATLVLRPEDEDLLVRIRVAELPGVRGQETALNRTASKSGAPGIVYSMELRASNILYQIRASGAADHAAGLERLFALFRCDPACVEIARLDGGVGTSGNEVRVSVPLSLIVPEGSADLSGIRAFTAYGEVSAGALRTVDQVLLPDTRVEAPAMAVGAAPTGTPAGQVSFVGATLTKGAFTGELPLDGLPREPYDIWARVCLGTVCGAASNP